MKNSKPLFSLLLAVILFASVPVAVRAMTANSTAIGIGRLGIATTLMTLYLLIKRRLPSLSLKTLLSLALLGTVFGLHWLLYFLSIKSASASLAALSFSTYGVQLVFIGALFKLNPIRTTDILACILASLGTFIIIPDLSFDSHVTLGILYGIGSAFVCALLPVIHQKRTDIPVDQRAWGQFLFALIFFLTFSPSAKWQDSTTNWILIIYLGTLVTLLAHTLNIYATTSLSPATTSILSYLYLPISLFLSSLLLGEQLHMDMLYGAALIFFANCLSLTPLFKTNTISAKHLSNIQNDRAID